MARDEMLEGFRRKWVGAIHEIVGESPSSRSFWEGVGAIQRALEPIMLVNNHAHLPTGGGLDYEAVRASREAGCLDFTVSGRARDRAKPARLTLEYIEEEPAESFLLLELAALTPRLSKLGGLREEFLDLGDDVVDRSAWDEGHLGYDEQGREIPLPEGAMLVTRWLGGKILFVTKGSRWNGTPQTYDGRHNEMSADEIRAMIGR